jgi:hypothetical protein
MALFFIGCGLQLLSFFFAFFGLDHSSFIKTESYRKFSKWVLGILFIVGFCMACWESVDSTINANRQFDIVKTLGHSDAVNKAKIAELLSKEELLRSQLDAAKNEINQTQTGCSNETYKQMHETEERITFQFLKSKKETDAAIKDAGLNEANITYAVGDVAPYRQSNDTLFLHPRYRNSGDKEATRISLRIYYLYYYYHTLFEYRIPIADLRNSSLSGGLTVTITSGDNYIPNFKLDSSLKEQFIFANGEFGKGQKFHFTYVWNPTNRAWENFFDDSEIVKYHFSKTKKTF